MSIEWAIPTLQKELTRKRLEKTLIGGDNEQAQDKRMFYCTNCNHVFQPVLSHIKKDYRELGIDIYKDFPSIGKERVDCCANCN